MVNLQKGLVGHWTFDAGATNNSTAYDSSAYDNHGSFNTGDISLESGKITDSYYFNGNGGVGIGNPDIDLTTTLSICFWFKTEQNYNSRRNPIDKAYGAEFSFTLEDNSNGELSTYFGSAGSNSTPYAANKWDGIPDNQWNHLVWIRDNESQSVTLYLNGESYSSNRVVTEWETPVSSNDSLVIGDGYTSPMYGNMDDVRIYNRVLSESEVRALYNMRSQRQQNAIGLPHTQNLLLHLNARNKLSVDESNNRWYDISGNNYEAHGTDGDGSINDNNFPDWEAKNGGRFILNGSEGWNVPGPIDTSGQVTLETWFYRTDLSADAEYLSDARNGTGQWQLTNYEGYNVNFHNDLKMNDPSGGDYRDTGATSSPSSNLFNRWTHLVATSDGNISEIYIDGEKITDSRLQRDNPFPTGIGKDFAIANRYTGSSHLQGYMSVYRIYDDVLTPAQVKSNYESEKIYYK